MICLINGTSQLFRWPLQAVSTGQLITEWPVSPVESYMLSQGQGMAKVTRVKCLPIIGACLINNQSKPFTHNQA